MISFSTFVIQLFTVHSYNCLSCNNRHLNDFLNIPKVCQKSSNGSLWPHCQIHFELAQCQCFITQNVLWQVVSLAQTATAHQGGKAKLSSREIRATQNQPEFNLPNLIQMTEHLRVQSGVFDQVTVLDGANYVHWMNMVESKNFWHSGKTLTGCFDLVMLARKAGFQILSFWL